MGGVYSLIREFITSEECLAGGETDLCVSQAHRYDYCLPSTQAEYSGNMRAIKGELRIVRVRRPSTKNHNEKIFFKV